MSKNSASDDRAFRRSVDGVTKLLDGVDVFKLVGRIRRLEQKVLDGGHRRWACGLSHLDNRATRREALQDKQLLAGVNSGNECQN